MDSTAQKLEIAEENICECANITTLPSAAPRDSVPCGVISAVQYMHNQNSRVNVAETYWKKMSEKCPNLIEAKNSNIQESQQTPSYINTKKTTPGCIVSWVQSNHKEENHKSSKKKTTYYIKKPKIGTNTDFSSEGMKARRGKNDIFQVL